MAKTPSADPLNIGGASLSLLTVSKVCMAIPTRRPHAGLQLQPTDVQLKTYKGEVVQIPVRSQSQFVNTTISAYLVNQ